MAGKVMVALVVSLAMGGCGKGIKSTSKAEEAPPAQASNGAPSTATSAGSGASKTSGVPASSVPSLSLGSWATLGELPISFKTSPTATLMAGGSKVLVWGHEAAPFGVVLDVAKGTWTPTEKGRFPRREHAAVLLPDGKVLLTGGANVPKDFYVMRSSVLFDPAANGVDKAESMLVQRRGHTAHLSSKAQAYMVGGMAGGLVPPTRNIDRYDPATNQWTLSGKLQQARYGHRTAELGGDRIIVVGGHDRVGPVGAVEVCTLGPKTKCKGVPLPKRDKPAVAALGPGKALIVGGFKTRAPGAALVFDADANTFKNAGRPHQGRSGHTATAVGHGRVLVAGGNRSGEAELYDLATDKFYECGGPEGSRYDATSLRLPDGRVLLIGGAEAGGAPVLTVDVWSP